MPAVDLGALLDDAALEQEDDYALGLDGEDAEDDYEPEMRTTILFC